MPKTITIPTTPGFTSSEFRLERAIGVTVSPFTGKRRTQQFDLAAWTGQVNLPPMSRAQAAEWQSFLADLVGTTNYFLFTDPDAKTPRGTYDGGYLTGEVRVNSGTNVESATLSFSGSTITSTTDIFDGLVVGDYITVSGATYSDNNSTFKITSKTSDAIVVVDADLSTESSTTGCKVRQNVKGSTALSLAASGNTEAGTIKKGDYLAIYDGNATTDNPVQLVMATSDAVETTQTGSPNHFSVSVQPKLRTALTDGYVVGFSSSYNKSRFRLAENNIQWSANQLSLYGLVIPFTEVIDG